MNDLQSKLREVQRISRARNLYEVLNVSHRASARTIKQAYRSLALIVHPDTVSSHFEERPNLEREFNETFQKVQRAYQSLTERDSNVSDGDDSSDDDNKRGDNNEDRGNDDANFGWDRTPKFTSNGPRNWWETLVGLRVLVCSPAILLVIIPLITWLLYRVVEPVLEPSPIFSFERNSEFVIKHYTEFGKIQYFVRSEPKFKSEFRKIYKTWNQLERDVIDAYDHKLHVKCNREKNKDKLLEEAQISGNRKTYMEATSEETPSCDKRQKILEWKQSNPLYRKKWHSFMQLLKFY